MLYAQIACCILFAITFLQSGLDKVLDFNGNLEWLKGHFGKTFLAPTVPVLLAVITVFELAAGGFCALGTVQLYLDETSTEWAEWGLLLSCASLLMLFFGQRVAKDYAGAVTLVTYFAVAVLGLFFLYA
jgi:putative oxidoreductase